MIIFSDQGSMPTADVFLQVPTPLGADGWTWGELPRYAGVLAEEYAYDADECAALVHTYGETIGRMIRPVDAERFRILLRGRTTGSLIRRAEWTWNTYARRYVPHGEAWDGWREAARAYWLATGELVENQRFEAARAPVRLPERYRGPVLASTPGFIAHVA